MPDSYLVWDSENTPPKGSSNLLLWRGFSTHNAPSAVSIPKLIEDNADVLKARYLAWIYDLGEKRVDGKRLIDHLQLRHDFSYWWMTLIAEKCNYAHSVHINDAIRLMAFDSWSKRKLIRRVFLVTSNQALVECFRLWCLKSSAPFEYQLIDEPSVNASVVRRGYKVLPLFFRGLIRLVHYYTDRWALRGLGLKEWQETQGRVTFFSYLFNLEPCAIKNARYQSRYWSNLPDELKKEGVKTNWLHLYCKDGLLPIATTAAHFIKRMNRMESGEQVHLTLDSFLSFGLFFKTLRDWARLIFIGRRLGSVLSTVSSDGLDIWPLFTNEWASTITGHNAIQNCLYLNLFEVAMKMLPQQKIGVYLYEQQPWELTLIHAWKISGHDSLIGAQHSTVLYWDLRYFHDPRTYNHTGRNGLPMPNKVAVNGEVALNIITQSGYPEKNLIKVEALRYLNLCKRKTYKFLS